MSSKFNPSEEDFVNAFAKMLQDVMEGKKERAAIQFSFREDGSIAVEKNSDES